MHSPDTWYSYHKSFQTSDRCPSSLLGVEKKRVSFFRFCARRTISWLFSLGRRSQNPTRLQDSILSRKSKARAGASGLLDLSQAVNTMFIMLTVGVVVDGSLSKSDNSSAHNSSANSPAPLFIKPCMVAPYRDASKLRLPI